MKVDITASKIKELKGILQDMKLLNRQLLKDLADVKLENALIRKANHQLQTELEKLRRTE